MRGIPISKATQPGKYMRKAENFTFVFFLCVRIVLNFRACLSNNSSFYIDILKLRSHQHHLGSAAHMFSGPFFTHFCYIRNEMRDKIVLCTTYLPTILFLKEDTCFLSLSPDILFFYIFLLFLTIFNL